MPTVIELLLEEVVKNRVAGELTEAFAAVVDVLTLEPGNLPAQLEWINLFDGLGEEVMPEVNVAWVHRLAGTAPGYVLQGLLQGNCGSPAPDHAIANYTTAIHLDHCSLLAYYYRGNDFFSIDKFTRAAGDFTHCLEIAPAFMQALYDRSETYGAMEDYDAAIADLIEYDRRTGGNQFWVCLQIVEYLSMLDVDGD